MITLLTPFEIAINWIIDLIESLSSAWSTLSNTWFTIGDVEVSFLGVFSIGVITTVLILKLVDIINPVG